VDVDWGLTGTETGSKSHSIRFSVQNPSIHAFEKVASEKMKLINTLLEST